MTSILFSQVGYFLGDDRKISDKLTIQKMDFNVVLDNEYATIKLIEIVKNNSNKVREGFFISNLSPESIVDDFVIYRDLLRLPAVILTKKRARRLYENIVWFERDPGLLEMSYTYGGSETEMPQTSGKFSVSIYPIPPYGFKRMEFSYVKPLKVIKNKVIFNLPISSKFGKVVYVKDFSFKFKINSSKKISQITTPEDLNFTLKNGYHFFNAKNFPLKKDILIEYEIKPDVNKIYFLGYLGSKKDFLKGKGIGIQKESGKESVNLSDGFFLAQKYSNLKAIQNKKGKNIFLLVDFSLSMKWANLKKLYFFLNNFISYLTKNDRFNIYIFNREFKKAFPKPTYGNEKNKLTAMNFLENNCFIDGTDVSLGISNALKQISQIEGEKYLLLVGDFIPTYAKVKNSDIYNSFTSLFKTIKNLKIYSFGIGDNINEEFLKNISQGYVNLNSMNEDEMANYTRMTINDNFTLLKLIGSREFFEIYPEKFQKRISGSRFDWFGRFKKESQTGILKITGDENAVEKIDLKKVDNSKKFIPKLWAKAKIEYLLKKIGEEGEKPSLVKEIVSLSRKFKIITPYTSMLCAPRSFLRPRFIQPGDPIIKVKSPEDVVKVSALLPTGENLNLTFLKKEKIWVGKFLFPTNIKDGKYPVEIVMRDKKGQILRERKYITIDTHPPIFKVLNLGGNYNKGELIEIKVNASKDTKTIRAILPGKGIFPIKWDKSKKMCVGKIPLPDYSGEYKLKIISQDFAHNQYSKTFFIKIN